MNLERYGAALVGVLWAYHGWMNIAPIAEEVTAAAAEHPAGRRSAVLLLVVLYCARTWRTTSSSRDQMKELAIRN